MNLKEIKQRIQSVKSTQKITSAMKLVSAAKLRRAQNTIENMLPYKQKLDGILTSFLQNTVSLDTPFTAVREAKKVVVIAVSSNSSLCGGFNANIIREARAVVDSCTAAGVAVELLPVGKKISDAMRKIGFEPNVSLLEQAAAVSYDVVASAATALMERFASGEIDRVDLVYTHFRSAAKQVLVVETLLPIKVDTITGETPAAHEYILEPGKEALLQQLLPRTIKLRLFTALLDSAAAEHAARMMAMQIATDNADDLIQELVREYNKGRQQAITNELLDIVSGSAN